MTSLVRKRLNNVPDTEELLSSCDIGSDNSTSRDAVWSGSGLRHTSGVVCSRTLRVIVPLTA